MNGDEQHICDNQHCDKPAPFGFICFRCVDKLEAAINEFDEHDLDELYQIAIRDIRPVNRNIRTTTSKALRQDALNIVAYTLWEQLSSKWAQELPTLHQQNNAVPKYQQIIRGCEIARNLIHGEPEYQVSPDHMNEKMDEIPAMPPPEASRWLKENVGVKVSSNRIRKWKQLGKIDYRFIKMGIPHYHPTDILQALYESREGQSITRNK